MLGTLKLDLPIQKVIIFALPNQLVQLQLAELTIEYTSPIARQFQYHFHMNWKTVGLKNSSNLAELRLLHFPIGHRSILFPDAERHLVEGTQYQAIRWLPSALQRPQRHLMNWYNLGISHHPFWSECAVLIRTPFWELLDSLFLSDKISQYLTIPVLFLFQHPKTSKNNRKQKRT